MFAIAMVALVVAVAARPTQAHFQWYDSVNDCEIRYEDETKYDSERIIAESKWEALKGSDNCVNIAPDTSDTSTDLVYKDKNIENGSWIGLYTWWPVLKDSIEFNEFYMDNISGTCQKANVAMHELGHAQRLAHSYSPNIMQNANADVCVLGPHDRADYREKWDD